MSSHFQFVDDHCDTFPVKWLCQLLEVSRSGFYRWRVAAPARAARASADEELAERIRAIHDDSDGTYGAPRVTAELRDAGIEVNHKRVERVMRVNGIVGVHLRKPVRTTVPDPYAAPVPDLIRRDFTASAPNTKYVGDITYLPVGDGEFLYLATVLDLVRDGWRGGRSPTTCAPSWSPTRCVRPPPVVAPPVSMGQFSTPTTGLNMHRLSSLTSAASWG